MSGRGWVWRPCTRRHLAGKQTTSDWPSWTLIICILYTCTCCFDGQFLLLSWALSRGCTASIGTPSLPPRHPVCCTWVVLYNCYSPKGSWSWTPWPCRPNTRWKFIFWNFWYLAVNTWVRGQLAYCRQFNKIILLTLNMFKVFISI